MNGQASFCVVVPAFNERDGIERCVRRVTDVLTTLGRKSSLIVVDDGSTDGTSELLSDLAETIDRLHVVFHERNAGYGEALRTGTREASRTGYDYVLFMDSDLTNDPADIPSFADKMDGEIGVIKASRYAPGGAVFGVHFFRVFVSRVGNWLAACLFRLPLTDVTNGFRAVRINLLRQMTLRERTFSIITEELYWCRHLTDRFYEIPVTLTNRQATQRQTSFTYTPAMFYRYLKYPLRSFIGIRPQGTTQGRT